MALIDCLECGGLVSDQAPTCPHCGVPVASAVVLQTSRSLYQAPPASPGGFSPIEQDESRGALFAEAVAGAVGGLCLGLGLMTALEKPVMFLGVALGPDQSQKGYVLIALGVVCMLVAYYYDGKRREVLETAQRRWQGSSPEELLDPALVPEELLTPDISVDGSSDDLEIWICPSCGRHTAMSTKGRCCYCSAPLPKGGSG